MNRRRFLLTSLAGALAAPLAAEGQQAAKVVKVGSLYPTARRGMLEEYFEKRMVGAGWVSGENVSYAPRYSPHGGALPALALELVRERVHVIVTVGTPASLAAKKATTTIPVVFSSVGDPVGVGLVSNLGHPEGNVTGISGITYQLSAKRLELLRTAVPGARRVAMLVNPTDPTVATILAALERGSQGTGVEIEAFEAGRQADLEPRFRSMRSRGVHALVVQPDGMFWAYRAEIVKLAAEARIPAVYAFKEDATAGGLMSYGASILGMHDQVVVYVDRILRGARPAELPVQEPTKFELVINLKTARALGLTIPPSLLARADQVIDQ
jgi:putative tryptophan/tyrosine transport system substrate-binding protein